MTAAVTGSPGPAGRTRWRRDADAASPSSAMAHVSPEGPVLLAWRHVEIQLRKLSPNLPGPARPLSGLIHGMELPADIERSLRNLRRTRNEVTHRQGRTPGSEAAADFMEGCEAMIKWLSDYGRGRLPVPATYSPYRP